MAHFTLRVALQSGTPVDDLRDPYVHVETEDLAGIVAALIDLGAEAGRYLTLNPDADWRGLDRHLITTCSNEWEDPAGTPWVGARDREAQLRALAADLEEVLHVGAARLHGNDYTTIQTVVAELLALAPEREDD